MKKRAMIGIDDTLHHQLKVQAAKERIPIHRLAERLIREYLARFNKNLRS